MKIGYIRISTANQNTARQKVMMQELGADQVNIDANRMVYAYSLWSCGKAEEGRRYPCNSSEAMKRLDLKPERSIEKSDRWRW